MKRFDVGDEGAHLHTGVAHGKKRDAKQSHSNGHSERERQPRRGAGPQRALCLAAQAERPGAGRIFSHGRQAG